MLSFLPRELFVKPPQITLILAIGPWGRGVMHLISPLGGKGLTRTGDHKFSKTKEALVVGEIRQRFSLVHIMGMSSVLSKPIILMYSTIQFKYHCWVNQIINPSTSDNSVMPNKEAITILWSRDGNLDNRTATCIQQTTLYP